MSTKEYDDKVVALIGAGTGIGREIAVQLGAAGAKLALACLGAGPLEQLRQELEQSGVAVTTTVLDVRDRNAIESFAQATFDHYGEVDYVFHNAGISAVGNAWTMPPGDWEWLLDVNLKGPIYSIQSFIPRLIAQDREAHFIITASAAGLITGWGGAGYAASKHAVIGLSETLELDLQRAGAKVKTHVICPGYVLSNLHNSLQYRAEGEWDPNDPAYQDPDYEAAMARSVKSTGEVGMPTDEAVRGIFAGIARGDFVILTHPQFGPVIEKRYHNLVTGARPGTA